MNEYIFDKESVSRLNYKNVLRQAASFGIISIDDSEKWMKYQDLRHLTSHEYGENFADDLLPHILPFY